MIIRCHNSSPYDLRRASAGASGYDLRADISCERYVTPGSRWRFGTGIYLELEPGWEAQVRGRSGNTMNHGIVVPTGTVDSDYRGEVGVILFNHGTSDFIVRPGDRIAQLVFAQVLFPAILFVELDALGSTVRGAGGFGSTGVG